LSKKIHYSDGEDNHIINNIDDFQNGQFKDEASYQYPSKRPLSPIDQNRFRSLDSIVIEVDTVQKLNGDKGNIFWKLAMSAF
jgi:hypothetical protein